MITPQKVDRFLTEYGRSGGVIFLRWMRIACSLFAGYFASEPVKSIVLLLLAILFQLMIIEWNQTHGNR